MPFDRQMEVEGPEPDVNSTKEFMDDIKEWVRDNIRQARVKYKSYYDVKHRDIEFNIGDEVLVRTHDLSSADEGFMRKLGKKWQGPVIVCEKVNPVTYKIMDMEGKEIGKRHVNDIKKFIARKKYEDTRIFTNSDRSNNENQTDRPVEPVLRRSNRVNYTPGMYRYNNRS